MWTRAFGNWSHNKHSASLLMKIHFVHRVDDHVCGCHAGLSQLRSLKITNCPFAFNSTLAKVAEHLQSLEFACEPQAQQVVFLILSKLSEQGARISEKTQPDPSESLCTWWWPKDVYTLPANDTHALAIRRHCNALPEVTMLWKRKFCSECILTGATSMYEMSHIWYTVWSFWKGAFMTCRCRRSHAWPTWDIMKSQLSQQIHVFKDMVKTENSLFWHQAYWNAWALWIYLVKASDIFCSFGHCQSCKVLSWAFSNNKETVKIVPQALW